MKDAKNHLKHVQKKVVRSVKQESPTTERVTVDRQNVIFKRPKPVLNKKKFA